ncbi:hypothetical protein LCGC14_1465550 [marine sediment metagenome]|uniref:Uncharacterized protein n=1 Tax=marine sediment metagenome TaxID=412755 RepID=A0A0F9LUH3_9ZZZZ
MSDSHIFPFLEIVHEDIHEHLEANRLGPEGEKVSLILLQERLAREAFGFGYRSLSYVLAGKRAFPADRLVPFCWAVGSFRILEYLAHEAGAALVAHPDVGEIDEYDLVGELSANVDRVAGHLKALVELFDRKPTAKRLAVIRAKTREMIAQALRCEAIYHDAVRDGPLRRRRVRKALAAGQGTLFGDEP